MSSQSVAERVALGSQTPRVWVTPTGATPSALADDTIELCDLAGVTLDEWQCLSLREGLAVDGLTPVPDSRWAASEVGILASRQNGKNEILIARQLAGLFLLGEFLLATAHEFKTNKETFQRTVELIDGCPKLSRMVPKGGVHRADGEEAIEVRDPQTGRRGRVRYIARSTNSGRGFPGVKCLLVDEAQILEDRHVSALMPTTRAVANRQTWYFGTAGGERAVHWGRIRRRALSGDPGRLVYLEWSADEDSYDIDSPTDWAKANPALGVRVSVETMADERKSMAESTFLAECMGIGKWPGEAGFTVIAEQIWAATLDPQDRRVVEPVMFGLDAMPDRSAATIAVAGQYADGVFGVEIVDRRAGVDWAVARLAELVAEHTAYGVAVDAGGPAGTVIGDLEDKGVVVIEPTVPELAQAAAGFYDAVCDPTGPRLRRPVDDRLDVAVAAAKRRTLPRGSWVWQRSAEVDSCPLWAVSLALWGFRQRAAAGSQAGVWVL